MVVPIASVREASGIGLELLLVPDYVNIVPGLREARQDIEQSINRWLVQPTLMLPAAGASKLRSVWSFARVHDAKAPAARILQIRLALQLELEADKRREVRETVECKLDVH